MKTRTVEQCMLLATKFADSDRELAHCISTLILKMLIHLVVILELADYFIKGVSVHKVNYRICQRFYVIV